jgi:hypothetical protein
VDEEGGVEEKELDWIEDFIYPWGAGEQDLR